MYQYLTSLSGVLRSGANVDDIADSLSDTQYRSKLWLVETLAKQSFPANPRVLILGGWYGSYLVPMLNEHIKPSHIYLNDINVDVLKVAKALHKNTPNCSVEHFDATHRYHRYDVDIVINTSCEHMNYYGYMLGEPSNVLYVLQSCDNKNDPGHINTSSSTDDFAAKLNLKQIVFAGRQALGHKNRFMIIGHN
jgi:hypothetical protein